MTNVGSFGVITNKTGSRVMQLALKLAFLITDDRGALFEQGSFPFILFCRRVGHRIISKKLAGVAGRAGWAICS